MKLIRPFEGLGKSDAGIAGGKGASLGEMTQAGIPVPPGFVILAGAFEKFLQEADLNQELDTILDQEVNRSEIRSVDLASEKIQSLILKAKMPEDIATEIQDAFQKLGAEYVAVRSSATAEDSTSAAWAGQLETYLNTTNADLLKNVQRCWASLFTPRAIFYRYEKGMHGTKISVAVVVQKMVQSEVSGIAFSVHPVTEDYNQLIIEAGFGLGEAIVSGQVTPDSFVIEKSPRRIIDKNISYQSKALWREGGGGNVWRELSEEEGSKPALTDEQSLELAELILKIESHYGFPCDIEWAYEAGHFFITQSRPITTLSHKI
jgi:pyruvate,water dikinase